MGLIKKAKDAIQDAIQDPKNKKKARDLARKYNEKIDEGIDRLGREVDKRTGGKHRDKVQETGQRAKDAVDDFAGDDSRRPGPDADAPPRRDA